MYCQTRHPQSALFALWKALQYQFIIEQYAQVVQSSEKSETPLMIKKCYALHTFYLREAYAIHLESVLAAPTPDASLSVSFLQFADFASEKEYCEVYEIQVRAARESDCEDRFPNPVSGVAPKQRGFCHSRRRAVFGLLANRCGVATARHFRTTKQSESRLGLERAEVRDVPRVRSGLLSHCSHVYRRGRQLRSPVPRRSHSPGIARLPVL